MYGPWGIKTHKKDARPDYKDVWNALLVFFFPILLAFLFLWMFGRI